MVPDSLTSLIMKFFKGLLLFTQRMFFQAMYYEDRNIFFKYIIYIVLPTHIISNEI